MPLIPTKHLLICALILSCSITLFFGQTIEDEAREQYTGFLDTIVVKRNYHHFMFYKARTLSKRKTLHEFHGFTTKLEKAPISVADSLNGFQWKGEIIIECLAYRKISWYDRPSWPDRRVFEEAEWREWDDSKPIKIRMTKKLGDWKMIPLSEDKLGNRKPSLEIIEKALERPMVNRNEY